MPNIDRSSLGRVEAATKQVERRARFRVGRPRRPSVIPVRTFWTTSTISTATVSGTTVATAKRVLGHGTARQCILDSSGNDIPDVNAADVTIYNPVVMTSPSQINTAMFCDCAFIGGVWRIVTLHKCPS